MNEEEIAQILKHIKGIAKVLENHLKSEEKPTTKPKNYIPYLEIINLYNETMPELRQCREITATRKSHIRARWQDQLPDMETWKEYFDYIRQSKFLMGNVTQQNRKSFQADFDWIIKESNYVKILEGKYHGKV